MKIEPSKNDAASDVEKDAPKEVPKPRQNVGFATIAAVLLFVGVILAIVLPLTLMNQSSDKQVSEINSLPSATGPLDLLRQDLPESTLRNVDNDENSPQAQAWAWLEAHPDLTDLEEWRKKQLFSLVTFYYAMQGPNWTNSVWLSYTDDECQWFVSTDNNVACNDQNEVQSVVVRNTGVPANQTIPPELALLTQLKTLQLSNNQIAQSFETLLTSTLVPMEHLAELSLDQNHLEGSTPTELGLMSNSLISLRLWDQNSKLVGSIPSEIGRLSQLEVLDLGVNDFTGQIPSTIGFLTSLTSLLFRKNSQLAGTLPPQIGLLTKLTKLDFGYCTNMQGSIPTEYGALSKLGDRSIWLNRNSLTGTIPTEIGRWTDMGLLLVNGNNLKGAIPTQIGLMEGLEEISMYENQLEGPIPSELGLLTDTKKRLTRVYLYDNALTGQVPTELVSLWENGSLEGLRLQNNDLSGTIPEGLCGMGKVENQDDWWEHGLWFDCNDKLCGCSWCPCA